MVWMWLVSAIAADPPEAEEIEIVKPDYVEGKVTITFPGREGDTVKCDGWTLGTLPLDTQLLAGVHTFEVTGKEPFEITTELVFENEETALALDLSKATPVNVGGPTGIRVISNSKKRRSDGSVIAPSEPSPESPPKTKPDPGKSK